MKTDPGTKSYELPEQTVPGLKAADHLADLLEIRTFCQSRGIATANTRIERYSQVLQEAAEGKSPNVELIFKNSKDPRFKSLNDWALYLLREVHELMWILKGLKQKTPSGVDDKLREIVSGSDFAALDTNSHSRNLQFELRIASYFCQAGCEVDLITETDVIATNPEFAFFIECKRVASENQLERRLEKAAKQLSKKMPREYKMRPTFGIVAADVTAIAFPHNGLTWAETPEHSKDIIRQKLDQIVDNVKWPRVCFNQNVLDYWFQIHIPSLVKHPPTHITRFSSVFVANPRFDVKAVKARSAFKTIFEICNKPDGRETPARPLKRRTGIHLPTGTEFRIVDPKILQEYRNSGRVLGNSDDVVAQLTLNGTKHDLFLEDLVLLLASVSRDEANRLTQGLTETNLELVIETYLHRFPYEEGDGQAEQTYSKNA